MIDKKEVIRYLGYKGHVPTAEILDLIEVCIKEVQAAAEPKYVARRFPAQISGEQILAGGISMQSKHLARHLAGCKEVVFFAATLGTGVDRLLHKYMKLQVSKAVVVQAAAAALIEAYCDQCQKELEEACQKENLSVRPRFSPGYGDFSLTIQAEFLQVLQAQKTAGILLTDGDVMLPEKSVTAIIGLREE